MSEETVSGFEEAAHQWTILKKVLIERIEPGQWHVTFGTIEPIDIEDDTLHLAVPSGFTRKRLETNYAQVIDEAKQDCGLGDIHLSWVVQTPHPVPDTDDTDGPSLRSPANSSTTTRTGPSSEAGLPTAGYTFDDFVVGSSNGFAHAAAQSVAETPGKSWNPLFIYGASGLGKTHLLHAIRHYVHQHYTGYEVRYVVLETMLNEFVQAIQGGASETREFRRRYRECDVLLVDDVQFITGKEGLQEEFFHTFSFLRDAGKQIVLTSDRTPDEIPTLEERLRTRFQWGLLTDIQPPDLETRIAIMRGKKEGRDAPLEILSFIAEHVTENIRELEGALIRVSAFAQLNKETMTLELARHVLHDLVGANGAAPITPQRILDATEEQFGFPFDDLVGRSRRQPLVEVRQIAMYAFRELTDLSFPAIGREFGGRDHTTVMHAVEKIARQMAEKRDVYDKVQALVTRIKHPA